MRKWLDIEFEIGDIVYLKTDPEQLPRMVTGMSIRKSGVISYELSQSTMTGYHYDFEISNQINSLKLTAL